MSRLERLKRGVLAAARRLSPRAEALLLMRRPLHDVLPPGLWRLDPEAVLPERLLELPGIDFREQEQLERLASWEAHAELFSELRADPLLNVRGRRPYVENDFYGTPDVEVYAAAIAEARPDSIVEIGAGYSTIVARRTIDRLGLDSRLVVVDPQPRTDVSMHADQMIRAPVETVEPSRLPLRAGTLLFIDSSHVVRAAGDVPRLFNELVPALPSGARVHVHDVFLPYDYPDLFRLRLYSEQYVLAALLSDSARYRVRFATHLMCRRQPEAMRRVFGPEVARDPAFFGVSFWFDVAEPG